MDEGKFLFGERPLFAEADDSAVASRLWNVGVCALHVRARANRCFFRQKMAICPLDRSYLIVCQLLCQVGILVGMGWGSGLFLRNRPLAYLSPGILGCKTRSREASGRTAARRAPTFRKARPRLPQGGRLASGRP